MTYILPVKQAGPDHPAGQAQVNGPTHDPPLVAQSELHTAAKQQTSFSDYESTTRSTVQSLLLTISTVGSGPSSYTIALSRIGTSTAILARRRAHSFKKQSKLSLIDTHFEIKQKNVIVFYSMYLDMCFPLENIQSNSTSV